MGFPGKLKFPIYPIILPGVATRVSFNQLSVLSTSLNIKGFGFQCFMDIRHCGGKIPPDPHIVSE